MNEPLFQLKKTWQCDKLSCLCQIVPLGGMAKDYPKKSYLKLSAQPQDAAISFLRDKPDFTPLKHAFNELLRKYIENSVLSDILRNTEEGIYILELHTNKQSDAPQYGLVLSERNPRYIELISYEDGQSIVRQGAQGTFTKRKAYTPPDKTAYQSILNVFASQLLDHTDAIGENTSASPAALAMQGSTAQRELVQKLRRRLRTISKSLAKQKHDEVSTPSLSDLEQQAKLLQSFAHLVKQGDFELRLPPGQTGRTEDVVIPLDPEKTVGDMVNALFVLLKKRRRGIGIHAEQIKKTEKTAQELQQALGRLDAETVSDAELSSISKHFGLMSSEHRTHPSRSESASPYKVYKSEGLRILVGKGAHENDELTKQAKSNDFWLHAVGQSGSHVLVDGSKFRDKNLPETIFRDAAILALHYSKSRQDRAGEVYYTRRGKIKKKKGMPPGLWNVEQAQTIFVRYTEAELKTTLDKMIS